MALRRLNSITDVSAADEGQIAISGSHGGIYPAGVASAAGLRAVIFNDAGIGFEQAGVGGVLALDQLGMAAAALDCMTCLIGSADDGLINGIVSVVNKTARRLGVHVGMSASDAGKTLDAAAQPSRRMTLPVEGQKITQPDRGPIHLLDSASVVSPTLDGEIIITGSHGALIGGDPIRALKARAHVAVFSDAGFGKHQIGQTRLPALQGNGVAAVTASHLTCRIGDAQSIYDTGVVSAVNELATDIGARPGMSIKAFMLAAIISKRGTGNINLT